jgi:hypothetical protein
VNIKGDDMAIRPPGTQVSPQPVGTKPQKTMRPRYRKPLLTAHVTFSVGWIGAALSLYVLALVAMIRKDVQLQQAADSSMDVIGWYVLVPFAFASLLTGLVLSLGTTWRLFRYYWVTAKLVVNLIATVVLIVWLLTRNEIPELLSRVHELRDHASTAVGLLLVAVVLAVYKPFGMMWYVRRNRQRQGVDNTTSSSQ